MKRVKRNPIGKFKTEQLREYVERLIGPLKYIENHRLDILDSDEKQLDKIIDDLEKAYNKMYNFAKILEKRDELIQNR